MATVDIDEESKLADEFVQVFVVKLHLEGATDLIKADVFGKSDPYCVVSAGGKTYSTKTVMLNLNPVWDESTQFVLFEDPKQLQFRVWDWDKHSTDDPIGDCRLSLDGFFEDAHTGFDGEITLENVKKGRIKVRVSARKLLPVELETTHKRLSALKSKQTHEIADRKQRIATFDSFIETQKLANAKLEGEIDAARQKSAELRAVRSKLVKKAVRTQGELDVNKQKKECTDEELADAKNELEPVLKYLDIENGNVKELLEEKTALEKEIEDLKTEIETKKRLKREAEERVAAAAALEKARIAAEEKAALLEKARIAEEKIALEKARIAEANAAFEKEKQRGKSEMPMAVTKEKDATEVDANYQSAEAKAETQREECERLSQETGSSPVLIDFDSDEAETERAPQSQCHEEKASAKATKAAMETTTKEPTPSVSTGVKQRLVDKPSESGGEEETPAASGGCCKCLVM